MPCPSPACLQKQLDKVLHYVELGKKEGEARPCHAAARRPSLTPNRPAAAPSGAKLGCGGGQWGKGGYYMEPTVFYDAKDDMAIARWATLPHSLWRRLWRAALEHATTGAPSLQGRDLWARPGQDVLGRGVLALLL